MAKPQMTEEYNEIVYELLHGRLVKGMGIDDAKSAIQSMGFSAEEIEKASKVIKDKLKKVLVFDDPPTIAATDRADFFRWYLGPTENSKNWAALKKYLSTEGRTDSELDDIDKSSSRVVSLLPSPGVEKAQGRGLVMGYVQSGKTTNFMSVAAKCADEGYRLIVVLSGVTNNLRDQTQSRLHGALSSAGDLHWHWLTDDKKDFVPSPNAANILSTNQNRSVMVIKKNAGRLQKLITWLESVPVEIRAAIPMLVIDDEADQASVNSAKGIARKTAINKRLLQLLGPDLMPKHAYVGYTATPFANMLIEPNDAADLFPRDFIVNLPKGDGYFGAEQLFGRDSFNDDDPGACEGSDLIRGISAEDKEMLGKAASIRGAISSSMPNSLKTSIIWFLVATAARRLRNGKAQWSSMLIHSSGRLAAHQEMEKLVKEYLASLRNLPRDKFDEVFKSVWEEESKTGSELRGSVQQANFSDIANLTHELAMKAKVIVDNSKSQDRLDYEQGDPEIPVIVVGGNTLARGLTLEGLISSYFLRTSNAYDALLQMGRWFGYRPGYEDLQRIWMSPDLVEWFSDLATVEAEIRSQIERYSSDEITPLELPVLIRTHPKMQVTAAAKMYNAIQARVGFSGRRQETNLLEVKNASVLENNLAAGKNFVHAIQQAGIGFEIGIRGTLVARDVSVELVKSFMSEYSFFHDARVVNEKVMLDYIEKVNNVGELESWNIMLMSKSKIKPDEELFEYAEGLSVAKLMRTPVNISDTHATFKAFAGSSDAGMDVPIGLEEKHSLIGVSKEKDKANEYHKLRASAGYAKTGLLGLYIIDKNSKPVRPSKSKPDLEAPLDVLGLTFFYPKSSMVDSTVSYIGPPVYKPIEEVEVDEDNEGYLDAADELDELQEI
jgi:hypothetical protein